MAEGGFDSDVNETLSSFADEPPSVTDVLATTVDELCTELRTRGVSFVGGTKPELQTLLLQGLGCVGTSLEPTGPESVAEELAPVETRLPITAASTVPVSVALVERDYSLPPPTKSPTQARGLGLAPPDESVKSSRAQTRT